MAEEESLQPAEDSNSTVAVTQMGWRNMFRRRTNSSPNISQQKSSSTSLSQMQRSKSSSSDMLVTLKPSDLKKLRLAGRKGEALSRRTAGRENGSSRRSQESGGGRREAACDVRGDPASVGARRGDRASTVSIGHAFIATSDRASFALRGLRSVPPVAVPAPGARP